MPNMKINDVLTSEYIETFKKGVVRLHGWVRQCRTQSDIVFMNLNDGSCPEGIQLVFNRDTSKELFDQAKNITVGCYIKLTGNIIDSPAKGQKYEMVPGCIEECNECDPNDYPLSKSMKLPTLRHMAHYRAKTKTFGSVFRIRNTIMFETHKFFQEHGFLHLDPNVVTTNECEGGAGVFTVTEMMGKHVNSIHTDKNGVIDYSKDHFKKQTYLTVSSQLQLEALACGMGNCYTTNKSFRSEHSLTNKHASEFTHLEIEMVDVRNDDLMLIGAKYIHHIIKSVYTDNIRDLKELNKFVSKGLIERYEKMLNLPFVYQSYDDCINTIKSYSDIKVEYGEDLTSEMEDFLTKHHNGGVFVYNWPLAIKSFYMKVKTDSADSDSTQLCENFDLLMPFGIGELIGGSMREHRLDLLQRNMKDKEVSEEGLEWYLDLRRFGSVPHGGFGLGLDRLIMMLTGMTNIRDVIPFPVSYQSCGY